MKTRLATRIAAMGIAILGVASSGFGCSSEEVVLATAPETSGRADGGLPPRCADDRDCPADAFCSKDSCTAAAGTCAARPVLCGDEGPPSCGCDGVTYWNDCLRRARGVSAAAPGECPLGVATPCGDPMGPPCPEGARCAKLGPPTPPACAPDAPGRCWVIPAACPSTPSPDRWIACNPPGAPCVDTCSAIRSGEPFQRADFCP